MDGRLATAFAELLALLWADTHRAVSPTKLKTLIGEKRPEFRGYQQHDAQELLTFLLDGLHEDVNRVPYPRPIVEDPTTEGKTDQEIGEEAWEGYLRRNNSRIVELFQFQVRSEITFPTVGEKSLTFDPMMYLSLQVPKPPHSVRVTVLTLAYPEKAPTKCSYQIPKDKTFKDLEVLVSEDCGAAEGRCFVFADLYGNRLSRYYNSDQRLSMLRAGDEVWAFEVAMLPGVPEEKHEFTAVHLRKRTKSTYSSYGSYGSYSSYSYGAQSGYSYARFAPPQIFAEQPGVTTNRDVRERLLAFAERVKGHLGSTSEVALTVSTWYGNDEGTALPDTDAPFRQLGTNQNLSLDFLDLDATAGKENSLPEPVEADGVGDRASTEVPLQTCMDAFQVTEQLSQDDWVYCRKTGNFEESTKKLDLWTVPEVLVVHLKRFGRETLTGPLEKIDTLVRFPMSLDLSPWVKGPGQAESAKYQLYATVNHSGSLGFGHYTAYARVGDGPDKQWRYFNDSSVSKADESDVVSKASYILFYERFKTSC